MFIKNWKHCDVSDFEMLGFYTFCFRIGQISSISALQLKNTLFSFLSPNDGEFMIAYWSNDFLICPNISHPRQNNLKGPFITNTFDDWNIEAINSLLFTFLITTCTSESKTFQQGHSHRQFLPKITCKIASILFTKILEFCNIILQVISELKWWK